MRSQARFAFCGDRAAWADPTISNSAIKSERIFMARCFLIGSPSFFVNANIERRELPIGKSIELL
jgi:hypothetical protein